MAGCAGNLAVGRESRVEVKLTAELDLGPGERVRVDSLHLADAGREAQRQLEIERLVIARVVEPRFELRQLERTLARNARR